MTILNLIKAAAVVFGLAGGAAQASTVGFDVDGAGSSASAAVTGCLFCTADINATTVAGLDATTFDLDVGESYTFDFIEFSTTGVGFGVYEVTATLAFEEPGGSVTSSGGGIFGTFFGIISGGTLTWDDAIQSVTLDDGTVYWVSLEQGALISCGCDNTVTTTATVTLESAPAPVPLPASALLLLGGVGGLGVLRLKRRGGKSA